MSVVTGASSGIGAATARLLAAQGSKVVLAARRAERIGALAAEFPGALAVPTDVTDPAQVRRLVEQALERHGRVDVVVNDAGQGLHVPVADLDPEDLRAVFDLNVVGPLNVLQAVLPSMRAQGAGAVVNVSSATSLRVIPGLGGYAATKAALNLLSATARLELAGAGIALSVVYPRLTATEFHEHLRAGHIVRGAVPLTPDPPELAARAIVFAIETGAPEVLVDDPPRPITPGGDRPDR
ncbi:MAG TPA: SDR family oxidoreductase [Acidimicrobiales bacterium]|nr:SDR family oxidoreductase [Acidimicrobiales bacterium]